MDNVVVLKNQAEKQSSLCLKISRLCFTWKMQQIHDLSQPMWLLKIVIKHNGKWPFMPLEVVGKDAIKTLESAIRHLEYIHRENKLR